MLPELLSLLILSSGSSKSGEAYALFEVEVLDSSTTKGSSDDVKVDVVE